MKGFCNLTPHNIVYRRGMDERLIEVSGLVARLDMHQVGCDAHDGCHVVRTKYGELSGVPVLPPGTAVIVSSMVAAAVAERWPEYIVLVPDTGLTCTRDAHGHVVSVSQFIRY